MKLVNIVAVRRIVIVGIVVTLVMFKTATVVTVLIGHKKGKLSLCH